MQKEIDTAKSSLDKQRSSGNEHSPMQSEANGPVRAVSDSEIGMEFDEGIAAQGKSFKASVQSQLAPGLPIYMDKTTIMTFNHLTPDGIAVTSITLDTNDKTYSDRPANITSRINEQITDMMNFELEMRGEFIMRNKDIVSKQMHLGIPASARPDQMAAIAQSVQYADGLGIKITITRLAS